MKEISWRLSFINEGESYAMHFTHCHSQLLFAHLWIFLLAFQFIICFICGFTLNYIDLLCVVSNHNYIVYGGQGEDTIDILATQLGRLVSHIFSYIRILSSNRLKYLFFANNFIFLSWLQDSMILLIGVRIEIFQELLYEIKGNVILRLTFSGLIVHG